jgi:hypothetical protein
MAETAKEVVIKTERGEVVARINLEDAVLHGHCEWYDGWGNLIAYGFFKNGTPFTGTFLNWTKFFGDLRKEDPYDAKAYCKDWVTVFEACFRSESPKYEMVIEAYCKEQEYPCGL